MGLMNIFRKNNNKITPFTMDEKIFFVKVFLQSRDILPKEFGDRDGDNLMSIAGTPQYTLVLYLDFLYMFMMNDTIRTKSIKEAAKSGIDLDGFSLNTSSLLKIAEYYTTFRKLPEDAQKEIHEEWQNNIDSSNKNSFDTFKDACYWWGDNIIEPLQMFDCTENANEISENIVNSNYWEEVEYQLSLNQSLIDSYFEIRGIE